MKNQLIKSSLFALAAFSTAASAELSRDGGEIGTHGSYYHYTCETDQEINTGTVIGYDMNLQMRDYCAALGGVYNSQEIQE